MRILSGIGKSANFRKIGLKTVMLTELVIRMACAKSVHALFSRETVEISEVWDLVNT